MTAHFRRGGWYHAWLKSEMGHRISLCVVVCHATKVFPTFEQLQSYQYLRATPESLLYRFLMLGIVYVHTSVEEKERIKDKEVNPI